jgi:3-isopropylmalate/(R)-2-methylmalate dehydratase small subunit
MHTKIIKGRVWRFGDNINTDLIIPARYLNTFNPKELAKYCMVDEDISFPEKVKPGDIIVAGNNFGCGSSREHAPIAIKAAGVACVVAKSFARIFYRNAINIGLPIVECHDRFDSILTGHELEIDMGNGQMRDIQTGEQFKSTRFPEFMEELIDAGGLMNWIKKRGVL